MVNPQQQNQESAKRRTLYYEVADSVVSRPGGKYFVFTSYEEPLSLSYASDRIWEWDRKTDTARYVKNRYTGIMTPVDPKEFMLIQLRAEEY